MFTGAEGIKTPAQAAVYGGTAGQQYDPCYHLGCDDTSNLSMTALEQMSDAAAHATISLAQSTQAINGVRGKGNFNVPPGPQPPCRWRARPDGFRPYAVTGGAAAAAPPERRR